MRSLVINITDVGADYHVDDEVLLWTPKVRGSSEDPDRLISTAPRRVPLTRGRATVEVEPGTLLVEFRCRGFADVEPRKIVVPAGNGEVTLRSLFDASDPLDPPVITALQKIMERTEKAAAGVKDVTNQVARVAELESQAKGHREAARTSATEAAASAKTATDASATIPAVLQTMRDIQGAVGQASTFAEQARSDVESYANQAFNFATRADSSATEAAASATRAEKAAGQAGSGGGQAIAGVKILTASGNFTAQLQAAINDTATTTVVMPAGTFQLTDTITIDKLTGKRLVGQGAATVLKPVKNSGKHCMQSTSNGGLADAELKYFCIDMAWVTGDKPANGIQLTNATRVRMTNLTVKNSGGHAFLLQGFGGEGRGTSECEISHCTVQGAGLKQNTESQGAAGFGVLIKDASHKNLVTLNRITGVSCGMGIAGSHTTLGAPTGTTVTANTISMADNETIAYECIGFTRECTGTSIHGNQCPVSRDNGISVGSYSSVIGNVIGEAWNHGIACSGVGTVIEANTISNIGIENSTRLKNSPKEWAVVALANPQRCVVKNNTYHQTMDTASAHHVVKINISQDYPRANLGGNNISGNVADMSKIKGDPYRNLNANKDLPDTVDVGGVTEQVPAWQAWLDTSKRYYAPVTYWWADQRQRVSNWHHIFANADVVPFVILNPRSGPGPKAEEDFTDLCMRLKWYKKPKLGYVRTTQEFEPKPRKTRPKATILNEVQKYVEFYDVDGVFLDEMVNGWSEQQTALIPFYRDLYHELKSLYGEKFLIVGNPGTVTKTDLLECADMLMTFENSAANYLSADDSNIAPHPYTLYPPHRFIHVVHDVETRDQAGKVLARMDRSNVANVFLTTNTYDGGVVSPTNNPWGNLPAGWLMDLQMAWARRQPLPTAGA